MVVGEPDPVATKPAAAILALVLLTPVSVNAQPLDPWQLVGRTTTTHLGGEGAHSFTLE
jgi:hypothetical protein